MIPLEPAAWISFEPGGITHRVPEDRPRVPQLEALQGRRSREDLRRHAGAARLRRGDALRRQERLPDVGRRRAHLLRHRPLGPSQPRLDEARRQRRQAAHPRSRITTCAGPRWATARSSISTRWTSGSTTSRPAATSRCRSSCPATACRCARSSWTRRPRCGAGASRRTASASCSRRAATSSWRARKKKGLIRRITESSAARTKFPAFSPDGKTIAAWTEVDGEEQLLLHAADNGAPPEAARHRRPGWHFAPAWSPDGKRLAWGDEKLPPARHGRGERRQQRWWTSGEWEISHYAWSPDSRYLAYVVSCRTSSPRSASGTGRRRRRTRRPTRCTIPSRPPGTPRASTSTSCRDRFINPYLDRFEARFIVNEATLPCVLALQADGDAALRAPRRHRSRKPEDKKDREGDEKKDDAEGRAKDEGRRTRTRRRRSSRSDRFRRPGRPRRRRCR